MNEKRDNPKETHLRVLILEDSEDDAELIVLGLRRAGFHPSWQRAESMEEMLEALARSSWDLILSDFNMPQFNALDALNRVRQMGEDTPFIVVSGAIGEEMAVQLMRKGAHDFISKSHLTRLGSAVERELADLAMRRSKRETERALRESRKQVQMLARAGEILSQSLDYEKTLDLLASLILTEKQADWCWVDVLGPDEKDPLSEQAEFRRVTVAHGDPSRQSAAAAFKAAFSRFRPNLGGLVNQVQASEAGVLVASRSAPEWKYVGRMPPDPQCRGLLDELGTHSLMAVPLQARGRLLGIVAFVRGSEEPSYDDRELAFAKQLCDRAALAVDNARLYGEAMAAISLREDVLGVVSHDLKNPLSAILMTVRLQQKLLSEEAIPNRDAQLVRQSQAIERAANQMNRMILDLLDLARIRGRHLTLELRTYKAGELIAEIQDLFQPIADERGIQLIVEQQNLDCKLTCDHDRMIQVFSNLLGNAVKFSASGSSITLSVVECGEGVVFQVWDTGPGIPESEVPFIFERFWQAREAMRRGKGAGLGLAIARGVVEAHRGQIWVESQPGKGSSFFVMILKVPTTTQQAA